MNKSLILVCLLAFLAVASATVYFKETFDKDWEKRWVTSDWKKDEGTAGEWKWTAGPWYGDKEKDKGIQTSQDARFYAISAKMPKKFNNKGKDLVLQFQIRFPQSIDCGGGYIKLLPSGLDQKKLSGDSKYAIMFGPDVCGTSTKRIHAIFNYKGQNLLTKKDLKCETDQLSHVYTLILHPDNTYEIRTDNKEVAKGSIFEDWDFLPPKQIKDPEASKPKDWVDSPKMDDPEDKKPEGWDDIPAKIADPEAQKPEDWDDEADGEWEAPTIDNPEYKGEWKPRQIDNPDYKGPWVHPMIDNPEYVEDDNAYIYKDLEYVGIEIWQVKSGTIFDNIIVTDDVEEAEKLFNDTFVKSHDAEKKMFDDIEKVKREKEEAERKKAEAERKKQEESHKDDDEDDEDDDDDDEDDKKTKKGHDEL